MYNNIVVKNKSIRKDLTVTTTTADDRRPSVRTMNLNNSRARNWRRHDCCNIRFRIMYNANSFRQNVEICPELFISIRLSRLYDYNNDYIPDDVHCA